MNAVNEAYYWNGHGGYTGTIAEKPGFTEFSVPLNELPVRELPQDQYTKNGKTTVMVAQDVTDRLASAVYWYNSRSMRWDDAIAVKVDPFTLPDEIEVPHWVKPDKVEEYMTREVESRKFMREDAQFFVNKMGRANWEKMILTYEDKWGNAVAIKTDKNEWLFVGFASC